VTDGGEQPPHSGPAAATRPVPRSSALRRWAWRFLYVILALLFLIIVSGEIIFQTNLPRNLVFNTLERQLGLGVSARAMSTGWFGHTTLYDVTLSLPLAEHGFISVPVLKVSHSNLPWLILSGSLTIKEIDIERPDVMIQQDSAGRWNLLQVLDLLGRAGGSQSAQSAATPRNSGIPVLPELHVTEATIHLRDASGRSTQIADVTVNGVPQGLLAWNFDAQSPGHLQITGKIAPGEAWAQQMTISLGDLGPWLSPWIDSWDASARLDADWSGRIDNNQIVGRLDITHLNYESTSASGALEIGNDNGQTALKPRGIELDDLGGSGIGARLDGGQIVLGGSEAEIQNIAMLLAGGDASMTGKISYAGGAGSITAAWQNVMLPRTISQNGQLTVQYTPSLAQSRLTAALVSDGSGPSGSWESHVSFDATGKDSHDLSCDLTFDQLLLRSSGAGQVDLSGAEFKLGADDQGFALTQFQFGKSNPVTGEGGYSFAKHLAWLSVDGRGFAMPGPANRTLDIDLQTWVDSRETQLDQFYVRSGRLRGFAQGQYVFHKPKPLSARVQFDQVPPEFSADAAPSAFEGALHSEFDVTGTMYPMRLDVSGSAKGKAVRVAGRALGDMNILIDGSIQNNRVSIHSDHIQLLGGNWSVSGHWPVRDSLFRLDDLQVHDLDLAKATQRNDIAGKVSGRCTVDVRRMSMGDLSISGAMTVSGLRIGDPSQGSAEIFAADKMDFPSIRVDGDEVTLNDIVLAHSDSGTSGFGTARVITTLSHPDWVWAKIDLSNWPIHPATGLLAIVNADGYADLDLGQRSAVGQLDLGVACMAAAGQLVDWQTGIDLNGRVIHAGEITGHVLGGFAVGAADIDMDHPSHSLVWMSMSGLDLSQLTRLDPGLSNTGGLVDGSFRLEPAESPRPLEATSWSLVLHPEQMRLANISVGDLVLHGFVGRDRGVLDSAPDRASYLNIAGGRIYMWGRVSKHAGDIYQSLLNLNLQNLDLNQIMHANPKAKKTPGVLGGQIAIVGWPRNANEVFGTGHLTLDKSDLAGFGPIDDLYDLMHLGHNANKPTGSGTVDFTVQNNTLTITGLRYFDKGKEILGEFAIRNLTNIPDSPLSGTAVGSLRPLSAVDLPVIGDIDAALNALQQGSLSIRIYGTVRQPKDHPIAFADIGNDMTNFLLGDTKAAHGE
jgi:hypothetical protein